MINLKKLWKNVEVKTLKRVVFKKEKKARPIIQRKQWKKRKRKKEEFSTFWAKVKINALNIFQWFIFNLLKKYFVLCIFIFSILFKFYYISIRVCSNDVKMFLFFSSVFSVLQGEYFSIEEAICYWFEFHKNDL